MKFYSLDLFNKRYQICRKLRIWPHLLKKSLMENYFFVQGKQSYMTTERPQASALEAYVC